MLKLKELREERNLNMQQAAKAIGIPYTTYVSYEKGERSPSLQALIRLAHHYHVSVDYMLCLTDKKEETHNDDQ